MDMKQFCDGLRKAAAALASGKLETFELTDWGMEQGLAPDDMKKVNASYIRTIMNRSPDVKAIGTVKVRRVNDDPELAPGFYITLNREPRRKVLTNDDVAEIEKRAVAKAFAQLLQTIPNITDLSGEKLEGAAVGISRYQAMIDQIAKGE